MTSLAPALLLAVAALVSGCAGLGPRDASRGEVIVTIDHASGRALPPEAPRPLGPQGYTELRYLGMAGVEAVFLETVHEPNPALPSAIPDAPPPDALPRASTSLSLDLAQARSLPVRGHVVDVETASSERVRYSVRRARGT